MQTPTGFTHDGDRVDRYERCELHLQSGAKWDFAREHACAIDEYWREQCRLKPDYFNGAIMMINALSSSDEVFTAQFVQVDFKSLIYWKAMGCPETGVCDGFGSALLRSAEGHIILGRQAAGQLNSGLAYPPGGFIDQRDVGPDGSIDIASSIARELTEETGVDTAQLQRMPGVLITRCGPLVSIAVEYRSNLPARELRQSILDNIASDKAPELSDIVVVERASQVDCNDIAHYARVLLRHVLPA